MGHASPSEIFLLVGEKFCSSPSEVIWKMILMHDVVYLERKMIEALKKERGQWRS